MHLLYSLAGVLLLIGTPIYLHAVVKLHALISAQEPDWVAGRRSSSIFYMGMPSVADPNVNLAVVWLAFGSRWRDLTSPMASKYVWRIRFLLPALFAVFVGVLIAVAAGAP